MASDHNSAALNVGHNLYTLRLIILDLASGFMRDPNERRYISSSKIEIAQAISDLTQMLEQIERGDTSQQVSRIRLSELPRALLETPRREPPYGPMCREPKSCENKGYCPLDPTCGD